MRKCCRRQFQSQKVEPLQGTENFSGVEDGGVVKVKGRIRELRRWQARLSVEGYELRTMSLYWTVGSIFL